MNKVFRLLFSILMMFSITSCFDNEKTLNLNIDQVLVIGLEGQDVVEPTIELTGYLMEKHYKDVVLTSSTDVVEINGKSIKACKVGSTTITASYKDLEASCNLNVYEKQDFTSITDRNIINYYGRVNIDEEDDSVLIENGASGFEFVFFGTTATVNINSFGHGTCAYRVYVDDKEEVKIFDMGRVRATLAKDLERKVHHVKAIKLVEPKVASSYLYGINTDGCLLNNVEKPELKIEFFGDSITLGMGTYNEKDIITWDEDADGSYASLLGRYYDAEISIIGEAGLSCYYPIPGDLFNAFHYINDDIFKDQSSFEADLVFINLGTNDAKNDPLNENGMIAGYLDFLNLIRSMHPNAPIICIYGMQRVNYDMNDCIKAAIEKFNEDDNIGAYYKIITGKVYGSLGHPDYYGHEQAFEKIIELIDNKNLLNK